MGINDILFQVLTGVGKGMNLFLLASGLSLIYGVLNVVNFAHATFYLLAAFMCYSITSALPGGFWLSLLIAPLAVAVLGGLTERLFSRLYDKEHFTQIMLAWALILVFGDLMKLTWGREGKMVPTPESLSGGVAMLGGSFPISYIFVILVGAMVGVLLYLALYRTRLGIYVRAAAGDAEMTSALGIPVEILYSGVFVAGCWLAGVGGVVSTLLSPAFLGADLEVILAAFIIVIIGGMGSVLGSLIGSLIYGVMFSLGILVLPRLAIVFLYVLMVLILIFRPYGILGKPR
jgi:branched-subunit amino acid ABC-type transport system permease component